MTSSDPFRRRIKTRLIHSGRHPEDQFGFVNTPIYRGSTVLSPTVEHLLERQGYIYGTRGTPTMRALETAWSDLTEAAGTVLVPTGLAAVSLALLALVKSGDDILVTDSVYLPTRQFCKTILARLGVTTRYYDPTLGAAIEELVLDNTRLIFTESPGSLSLEIQDIPAISEVCKRRDLVLLMDNTWATPLFFSPHAFGVDVAIDAGTKYLSGHSDLLLGLVSANEHWFTPIRETFDAMALTAGPEDIYLALRGLRTMALRVKEAEGQALDLAKWLERRPEVKRVIHPALPSHPQHPLFKRDFSGSTGLFSVVLNPTSTQAIAAFLDGLELFGMGYSWGGFESLVIPFDCSKFRTQMPLMLDGPTLRFSVGLEDIEDLKADLERGFMRLRNIV